MKVTGKLIKILEVQTGTSSNGTQKKQDFIIETIDSFTKKICISNWNDKVDLNKLKLFPGCLVNCTILIESKEFSGKWFTNINILELENYSDFSKESKDIKEEKKINDSFETMENEEGDLPF